MVGVKDVGIAVVGVKTNIANFGLSSNDVGVNNDALNVAGCGSELQLRYERQNCVQHCVTVFCQVV